MKMDKLKNYSLELILCIVLFFALFVSNIITRIILSVILIAYTILISKILLKRNTLSMYHKQVTLLMISFAAIYLIAFYLMGVYFGYYKATVKFSIWSIFNYIIPLSVIMISSEVIRSIFLSTDGKISKILTTISMILIDLIVYTNIYDIVTFDGFLNIMSYTVFSSIACNLLYNYISLRYGYKPNIAFRLITGLYAYIVPFIPDVYIFFRAFLRMIYPYFIYVILEHNFSKDNLIAVHKDKKKSVIYTIITIIVMVLVIMLISCKYKYGILVIGSGSMTGTIDKGDAIIFESYTNQEISKGQVIVFEKNNVRIVHRVIDIKIINGQTRYYTKGDYNVQADDGYITKNQIFGISKLKIKYIGYPTIWLRSLFT